MNRTKIVLSMAALAAFMAMPVYAQHGGGHGASGSMHGSASSMHGNSADAKAGNSSSTHGPSSVSEKLSDNTKLASKLQGLLPAGTDLTTASGGFKNLGQFVAAVHVSHNLGIPFDQLKAKMIGPPKESLGQAIHALKPDADSKAETSKATQQAKQDMDDSKSS